MQALRRPRLSGWIRKLDGLSCYMKPSGRRRLATNSSNGSEHEPNPRGQSGVPDINLRRRWYAQSSHQVPLESPEMLQILSRLPWTQRRLDDYQFAAEALTRHGLAEELIHLLADMARREPVWWEQVFSELLSIPELTVDTAVRAFVRSMASQGHALHRIHPQRDRPLVLMLRRITQLGSDKNGYELVKVLVALDNPLVAGRLASALLGALALVDHSAEGLNTILALWEFKVSQNTAQPLDLRLVMMHASFCKRADLALQLYDKHIAQHSIEQGDALLIAAAQERDWIRLQTTFETLESADVVDHFGSRHYSLVLQSLGLLGGRELLESVWRGVHDRNPGRGVFHALIHSYGVLGLVDDARKVYEEMLSRGITPVRATFRMLSQVYRDAHDLAGALDIIGNHMIARYSLGLSNGELSVLLSLCSRRRDAEAGRRIWEWAQEVGVKPDARSYNAYLSVLAEAGEEQAALNFVRTSPFKPQIDTLTVLLSIAGRRGNAKLFSMVEKLREKHALEPDTRWFAHVMRYHATRGDLAELERLSVEIPRKYGLRLGADHYRLLAEAQGRAKQFGAANATRAAMVEQRVPLTFGALEEWLRMSTRPGTPTKKRLQAAAMAERVLQEGVFDEHATAVPRTQVPARVLRPVVRRMIKMGLMDIADALLRGYVTRYGATGSVDLRALQLELADAKEDWKLVERIWPEFIAEFRRIFVLQPATTDSGSATAGSQTLNEDATYLSSEKDRTSMETHPQMTSHEVETSQEKTVAPSSDVVKPHQEPLYMVARRYRNSWARQFTIRLHCLGKIGSPADVLEFPSRVQRELGIGWPHQNWNAWVQALLEVGLVREAFDHVAQATRARKPHIMARTMGKLQEYWPSLLQLLAADKKEAETLALAEYGALADFLRTRAARNDSRMPAPDAF